MEKWWKMLVPLVNIKIAGKWMVIPPKMVLIGIDPYPNDEKWWEIEGTWLKTIEKTWHGMGFFKKKIGHGGFHDLGTWMSKHWQTWLEDAGSHCMLPNSHGVPLNMSQISECHKIAQLNEWNWFCSPWPTKNHKTSEGQEMFYKMSIHDYHHFHNDILICC